MNRFWQILLLFIAVLALLGVGGEIAYSVAATTHGNTAARVFHVRAGPYPLLVSLYTYPAHASYALPFSIAPEGSIPGSLNYQVVSSPAPSDVPATPVRASLSPDPAVHNGVQGAAEITVQGDWTLDITVNGDQGQGYASVPVVATAPPAMPLWLGWGLGLVPLLGLLLFLLIQIRRSGMPQLTA